MSDIPDNSAAAAIRSTFISSSENEINADRTPFVVTAYDLKIVCSVCRFTCISKNPTNEL
jgi:hypothetical protein